MFYEFVRELREVLVAVKTSYSVLRVENEFGTLSLSLKRNNEAERSLFGSPWRPKRTMEGFQDHRGIN